MYRTLARRTSLTSPKRALAAGVGAYVGINAAALAAAIEFGIQPDLFYKLSSSGAKIPLYAPFHLSQTIPTMLFAHLVVAGVVDGALTVGVVVYLQRANLPLLRINHDADARDRRRHPAAPQARLPVGLRRAGGDGCARPAGPAGHRAPPSARTRPPTSTSRGTG